MEILQSLGIDQTVLFHLLVFLVVFAILSQFLFKPMGEYLEGRKKVTDSGLDDLKVLEQEYESRVSAQKIKERALEKETGDWYSREINEHIEKLREKVDLLKDQNEQAFNDQVKKIEQENKELKDQMESFSSEITEMIYAKVTQ